MSMYAAAETQALSTGKISGAHNSADEIIRMIHSAISRLEIMTTEVARFGDQVHGPTPQATSDRVVEQVPPPYIVPAMHILLNKLEMLHNQINRVGQI